MYIKIYFRDYFKDKYKNEGFLILLTALENNINNDIYINELLNEKLDKLLLCKELYDNNEFIDIDNLHLEISIPEVQNNIFLNRLESLYKRNKIPFIKPYRNELPIKILNNLIKKDILTEENISYYFITDHFV